MRRSICYCEPTFASAGEVNTWRLVYTVGNNLPKGTRLKFDLATKGRNIDWELPTANLKEGRNTIFAHYDDGRVVQAKEVMSPGGFIPSFEFILPAAIPAGESLTIVMGSPKPGENTFVKLGNRAQTNTQRRRSFLLFVDPTGKNNFGEPETFNIDVRGNELANIRVMSPSVVIKNKRFDVIVRFEDEFGNLTNNAAEESLIELTYENIRENLSWKLFIPETGFIALPNLYFNEAGVYTIRLVNTHTKKVYRSYPIKCLPENGKHTYWGFLHGESEKFDSTENIENCLRHFRDEKALHFFASSPFESQEETPNDTWKQITQNMAEIDEPERFSTFVGFQWEGEPGKEGVREIIYLKDGKQILRKKDVKYNTLSKIYKSFSPKEIISIPCFSMGKGYQFNFNDFAPEYERVVEIYNSWGSSECTEKEGNPLPIKAQSKKGVQEAPEGSIQKALQRNCRFGFVAGGLDDRGIYADFFENDQDQYPPGLTAIVSSDHTRANLVEALYNRACYATSGERIILGIQISGTPMGGEISTAQKPGLIVNRHISGYVAGTGPLTSVEIIRNGKVLKKFSSDTYFMDFEYDDFVNLDKVVIDAKDKKPPFAYYYLRIQQEDGHMAWSSPIWVDYVPVVLAPKPVKKIEKPTKKVAPLILDDEEEDEDFDEDFDEDDEE